MIVTLKKDAQCHFLRNFSPFFHFFPCALRPIVKKKREVQKRPFLKQDSLGGPFNFHFILDLESMGRGLFYFLTSSTGEKFLEAIEEAQGREFTKRTIGLLVLGLVGILAQGVPKALLERGCLS